MSSYFANAYMPDMRNGGVVPPEHHQHYGAAVVPQGGEDPSQCGVPPHHYGGPPAAGQPPQGMPYPRFPPYDRMDIRNAAYYNAQQQGMVDPGYRPDSPGMGGGGMVNQNGHQTPVVYASCKLQAVSNNGMVGPGSPPDLEMNSHHPHPHPHHMNHHQHHQTNHQPPPNHQMHQQPISAQATLPPNQMMGYQNGPHQHHQAAPPQHVVSQQQSQPPPQQQAPPPNNTSQQSVREKLLMARSANQVKKCFLNADKIHTHFKGCELLHIKNPKRPSKKTPGTEAEIREQYFRNRDIKQGR
ncbi:unnamed protein product [Bemisia tabaci]|uniref:Uncharacterized protein n=1 Tax=Bemisia tabaci TaxID=7038 RepID=A0A9P0AKY2_BEMTA|nr:unnamed protein product [Bemisia tabaci]